MASDPNLDGKFSPSPFSFRKRNKELDWRKIASLDLDKLIRTGNTEELQKFIAPVLFCRAEDEFDMAKTDPGFIRVFKLCQLIGEYLQELFFCVKKELRKTRDVLESTQILLIGKDNLDEVDSCPYCPKKFMTPYLVLGHLDRSHQGLPIPASLQNLGSHSMFPRPNVLPQCCPSKGDSSKGLGLCIGGGDGLATAAASGLGGSPTVYAFTLSPDGTLARNPSRQQNPGSGESSGVRGQGVMTEIKLCISTSGTTLGPVGSTSVILPRPSSSSRVALTNGQNILANSPPESLSSQIDEDKEKMSKTPENQEKHPLEKEPRAILQVEDLPLEENAKENNPKIQSAISTQTSQPSAKVSLVEKETQTGNEILMVKPEPVTPPPINSTSIGVQTASNPETKSPSSLIPPTKLSPPSKPNNVTLDSEDPSHSNLSISPSEEEYLKEILLTDEETGEGDVFQSRNQPQNNQNQTGSSFEGAGETPRSDIDEDDDDYDDFNEEDENDDNGNRRRTMEGESFDGKNDQKSHTPHKTRKPKSPKPKIVFDAIQGKLIDAADTKSQMDLVRDRFALDKLDARMASVGVDPEVSHLSLEELGRAFKNLKGERKGLDKEDGALFQEEINNLKKEVDYEVTKTGLAHSLDTYATRNKKLEPGRLANMLSKVKKSGVTWRQKVATVMKGRQDSSTKGNPPNPEIKTTFFSNWGRKKQETKEENVLNENSLHQKHDDESDSDSSSDEQDSSSDVIHHPYMTRSRPILREEDGESSRGRKSKKRNHSQSRHWDSISSDEDEDDSYLRNENVDFGPRPMYHSSPASTPRRKSPYKNQSQQRHRPISPISPQPQESDQDSQLPKPKPRPDKGKSPVANNSYPFSGGGGARGQDFMPELKNKIQSRAIGTDQNQPKFGTTFDTPQRDESGGKISTVAELVGNNERWETRRMEQKVEKSYEKGRNSWDSSD